MDKNTLNELYDKFETRESGLTTEEAKRRIESHGKNIFPTGKKKSWLLILLNQFKSPIIIILLVAIILSLVIKEFSNIIFILAVILINTIIGFVQEYQAEHSAQKLQTQIRVMVNVLRDGERVVIDSENLVVGDIIFLESGNRIPADVRLIETKNFKVDESVLSGESMGVVKNAEDASNAKNIIDNLNMAFTGTMVLTGRATAVVVQTGYNTEYGKIAEKVVKIGNNPSPLTIRINKFTKQISVIFVVIALALSILLYFKGYDWYNIFFSVVALTVSAIPEGLTTGMTICLSLSSNRMAKKNVIVKHLSAVEGLGSCTVIASDKTGTLTMDEQTAQIISLPSGADIEVTGTGYNLDGKINFKKEDKILKSHIDLITKIGSVNNEGLVHIEKNKLITSGDSIDIAFKILALKNKTNCDDVRQISMIPYESEQKYSAFHYDELGQEKITVKGSLEVVLNFCSHMLVNGKIEKLDRESLLKKNMELAGNGFRLIALAYGDYKSKEILKDNDSMNDIKDLIFVGMVGFIDPVRDDAVASVRECQNSGIKVCMITGDHPLTAYHIGKQLGIVTESSQVVTGEKIDEMKKLGDEKFDEFIKNTMIFARVTPLQKYEIVESYKRQGEFVAVSGDGVNDVLALKEANIGVSVGSGTDIAKDTADLILADDKFSSITKGVQEGKKTYSNIRNVVYLLMSTGICEVMLYFLSVMFNLSFPLTGVQFLWLNLVTNGIQSNIFAFEKNILTAETNQVRKTKENLFNKLLFAECFLSTIYIGLTGFILYYILIKIGLDVTAARTYLLTHMVFMETVQTLNCRNEYLSTFKTPVKNNPWLIIVIIASISIQIMGVYIKPLGGLVDMVPINLLHVVLMMLFSISLILLMETFKYFLRKRSTKLRSQPSKV